MSWASVRQPVQLGRDDRRDRGVVLAGGDRLGPAAVEPTSVTAHARAACPAGSGGPGPRRAGGWRPCGSSASAVPGRAIRSNTTGRKVSARMTSGCVVGQRVQGGRHRALDRVLQRHHGAVDRAGVHRVDRLGDGGIGHQLDAGRGELRAAACANAARPHARSVPGRAEECVPWRRRGTRRRTPSGVTGRAGALSAQRGLDGLLLLRRQRRARRRRPSATWRRAGCRTCRRSRSA